MKIVILHRYVQKWSKPYKNANKKINGHDNVRYGCMQNVTGHFNKYERNTRMQLKNLQITAILW